MPTAAETHRLIRPEWLACESPPALTGNRVHLWNCELGDTMPVLGLLSADERVRTMRLQGPAATHFAHARLALRRILSGYLKHPAEQIVFHYENNGRPGIAHPAADIDFNLSHTGNRMVLAVSQAFRVGVDIEVVRASPRHAAIARRFLTADDAERIARLDAASVPRAFARAWTRFEAARKLSGTGVFAAEPHSPPSRCIAFAIDDGIVGQLCHNAITRTDLVFLTPDGNLLGGTDSQQV